MKYIHSDTYILLRNLVVTLIIISSFFCSHTYARAKHQNVQVKLGSVLAINTDLSMFVLQVGTTTFDVRYDTETEFFTGKGERADISMLQEEVTLYVFGVLNVKNNTIHLEKIVMKNKSRLNRDNTESTSSFFSYWLFKKETDDAAGPATDSSQAVLTTSITSEY